MLPRSALPSAYRCPRAPLGRRALSHAVKFALGVALLGIAAHGRAQDAATGEDAANPDKTKNL